MDTKGVRLGFAHGFSFTLGKNKQEIISRALILNKRKISDQFSTNGKFGHG